jgi:hypothetical protein
VLRWAGWYERILAARDVLPSSWFDDSDSVRGCTFTAAVFTRTGADGVTVSGPDVLAGPGETPGGSETSNVSPIQMSRAIDGATIEDFWARPDPTSAVAAAPCTASDTMSGHERPKGIATEPV